MEKNTAAFIALFTVFSALADEEFIERNMIGTEESFHTWERYKMTKFYSKGGPEDKSYISIAGPHMILKSMDSELESLKGRKVALYGIIKADNVEKTQKHWEGVKFQIVYKESGVDGTRFAEGNVQRTGSYDWKEFETCVQLPQNLSSFTIKIGIQGTSGTIYVSDIDLKIIE